MRTLSPITVAILLCFVASPIALAQEAVQPDLRQPKSLLQAPYQQDDNIALASDQSQAVPAKTAQPTVAGSCGDCGAGPGGGVYDSCHLDNVCACDPWCDGCPCWCIRAGAVVLQRQADPSRVLVSNISTTTTTLLDASQFEYPMRAGPDIDVIHHGCNFDVEARYFSVDGFAASVGPTPVTGIGTVHFAAPFALAGTSFSAADSSQLWSGELNLRKEVIPCCLTVLAGYRHIELDERILGTFSAPRVGANTFTVQAFNHMDGFQVGGEGVLWRPCCGRFRLEADAKIGLFDGETSNFGSSTGIGTAAATGGHAVFMAEWGITGVVQITPHLTGRAGYEAFVLDGVGLASRQMANLNPITGTATTETGGCPLYEGFVVALQYCW
jgi:hypothetical protein